VIFTAGSAACGLAPSQGVGGAASSAVVLAMIVSLFPSPAEQASAFGIFSLVALAGAAVGLVAGGVITSAVNWHWVFFVNIPLGLATFACAWRLLPAMPGLGLRAGADVAGAVLGTSALMLGVYAIVALSTCDGRGLARSLRGLHRAAGDGPEPHGAPGHIPVRRRLRLQRRACAAVGRLPQLLLSRLARPRAGAWVRTARDRRRLPAGGSRDGRVLRPLFRPAHADYLRNLLLPLLMLGLGGGLTFPSLTMLAMSRVRPTETGLASGLLNTTGQVGEALGLAVLAALSAVRSGSLTASAATSPEALADGFHAAGLAATAIVGIALLVTLATLRPRAGAAVDSHAVPEAA